MEKIFIDSNLFIRYLVNDISSQIEKVEHLFDLAEKGEIRLITGPPVFFEIAWTLKSFYKMSRRRIYECLSAITGIQGLDVIDIDVIEEALELYINTSADFGDAYMAVLSKQIKANSVATFNKRHFKDLGVNIYKMD